MTDNPQSLSACFSEAQVLRVSLDNGLDSNSSEFQDKVASAIAKYQECLKIADQVSLFSPNESLEDVLSRDIQYFVIHYHIAELLFRNNRMDRKTALLQAREELEKYLKLIDSYDILSKEDTRLYERYQDNKAEFSTVAAPDPAVRRQNKIARFKEEKALKQRFEYLKQNPQAIQNSDETLRSLFLTQIAFSTHQAFQSLESIAQELHILSLAPPAQPDNDPLAPDARQRSLQTSNSSSKDAYSERLDPSVSELLANARGGPILSKEGRPIRPFTLLDSRQRVRDGVFRPDHNLPTMTIDEYLEEEKRRGGIIEGGGEKSGLKPVVDEDDHDIADKETAKARYWDEFKEENPRGSGNTMNMG